MKLITVTNESDTELFQELCEECDFDHDHVPKHGKGYVTPKSTLEDGRMFECGAEWDYSWGIEWDYVEWRQVTKFTNNCPCCGQELKE